MNDTNVLVKIGEAVQAVTRLTQGGSGLRDALIKVAVDHNLTTEQVKRVVETFNTHNTLSHFRSGEKRAEFPVADAREVIAQVFQTKAAAFDPAFPTPDEYLIEDEFRFIPHQDRVLLKQAEAVLEAESVPARYLPDPNELVGRVLQKIDAVEKQAQSHQMAAIAARDDILNTVQGLAASFQRYGAAPMDIFVKEAQALYGARADQYLPMVWELVPVRFRHDPHVKQASVIDASTASHQLFQKLLSCEERFIKEAMEAENLFTQAAFYRDRVASLMKEAAKGGSVPRGTSLASAAKGGSPEKKEDKPPAPAPKAPPAPPSSGSPQRSGFPQGSTDPRQQGQGQQQGRGQQQGGGSQKAPDRKKILPAATGSARDLLSAIPATGALGSATGWIAGMQPLVPEPQSFGYWERMGDTLRMQDTIQQVMTQDPILSSRSPEELLPVIQTVVRVAPQVAMHPPVLAAILRDATTGPHAAIDPMTLTQLAEAQKALIQNQMLQREQFS